ncbi:hypothetical protein LTR64_008309 [Lithohypha guttulata]|uniref:uncharacterized protein n=1 Tax=Lithohypha guttulata TaxID=1690604 RepID=UPI002DDEB8DF|nr:hypothetical protein LTR51_008461 [Lithohypha guttulata]
MDLLAVFPQTPPSDQAIDALASKQSSTEQNYYDGEEDEVLIEIYRLTGQKVWTISIDSNDGAIGVIDVAWRDDGVILAVVTSDNMVRLVNSFSGKVVHSYSSTSAVPPPAAETDAPKSPSKKRKSAAREQEPQKRRCIPTCIHYSTHFSDTKSAQTQLRSAKKERGVELDDLLGFNVDVEQTLKLKADLPREIANIDVEQFLPKLATLPANGMGDDDVFSSRTSIDTMFHPVINGGRHMTDITTIAQSDGHVHLRVFDSFEVGDVDLNNTPNKPKGCRFGKVRQVAGHPLSKKLCVMVEEEAVKPSTRQKQPSSDATSSRPSLHSLSLNLDFLEQSSLTFPILATKATQLHNLLRYLRQIESQMAREVKTAFDLPVRFLRNLEEDLKEQDGEGSTFKTSAYHALLTGEVHGKFKEWLAEVLGDRGVKRWDKAVHECLELVRRLVNENWNPAVERAGVVVSRLTGLAMADATFGVDQEILDGLQDTVSVMAVLGEDLLRDVGAEITGFNAFMQWLKREVEMAGLEDTSEKLDEMREASDHADVGKVITYISEGLNSTSVKKYIQETGSEPAVEIEKGPTLYEQFKKNREAGQKLDSLWSLKSLTDRLGQQTGKMFQQVAMKLRKGVKVEYLCRAGDALDEVLCQCRMVRVHGKDELDNIEDSGADEDGKQSTEEPDDIHSKEYDLSEPWLLAPSSEMAGTIVCERSRTGGFATPFERSLICTVPDVTKVLDLKFADDKELLVLVVCAGRTKIVSVTLGASPLHSERHVFGGQSDGYVKAGLQPGKLEVNGRKGRRTVTVLDEQGRGYGVFDLDTSEDQGPEDDDVVMS